MLKLLQVFSAFMMLLVLGAVGPVLEVSAASSGDSSDEIVEGGSDDSYAKGARAVEEGNWKQAISHLERAVNINPQDPDGFNLLAYSYRRMNKLDPAFSNYEKALSLDPGHRGAHEYVGEAYLMIGELERAEYHLSRLEEICGASCAEAEQLGRAISVFRENGEQSASDQDW